MLYVVYNYRDQQRRRSKLPTPGIYKTFLEKKPNNAVFIIYGYISQH